MKSKLIKVSKKIVSLGLSLGILGSCASLQVCAENQFGAKIKTLAKQHPIAASSAAVVGASSVIVGSVFGINGITEIFNSRRVCTPVDNIPDDQIEEYLRISIDKFENYGKEDGKKLFAVSDRIKQEADPRVLALVVTTINMIFEKDRFFVDAVKSELKRTHKILQIDWGESFSLKDSFCELDCVVSYEKPYIFKINKKYGKSLTKVKKATKNWQSPQRAIIWEFGEFFDVNLIKKDSRLTLDYTQDDAFDRGYPTPFADLLADYILKLYPENDIFVKKFCEYLTSVKEDFYKDKKMFYFCEQNSESLAFINDFTRSVSEYRKQHSEN